MFPLSSFEVYRDSGEFCFSVFRQGATCFATWMAGLILSPEDRAHFLAVMRRQTNSAVHRRVNVLLLLDDGWSAGQIAAALYLDASTVAEHRALYAQRGRSGIAPVNDGLCL